jgi:hypothetical protein
MDRLRAPVPAAIWINLKRVEAQVSQMIRYPLPISHITTLTTPCGLAGHPPATDTCIKHCTSATVHNASKDTPAIDESGSF